MVRLENVTVTYLHGEHTVTALESISLSVPTGALCAVIGPSGCGKSTLLRVIAGIEKKFEGTVLIRGVPIQEAERNTAFMPQNYGLLEWKTVYENIVSCLRIRQREPKEQRERAIEVAKKLNIETLFSRYPSQISGGQRQRTAIARSLVFSPDLFLLDEPFSALDEITREEIQDVFYRVWEEARVTSLLVTHSIEEAVFLGSTIVILSPAPGKVLHMVENSLSGKRDLRNRNEFYEMCNAVRNLMKQGAA